MRKIEKFYKIETFIPIEALNKIKTALYDYGFGKIGNYNCCLNWFEVNSSWKPNEKANPYLGSKNKLETTKEYKLEFRCAKSDLKLAINLIKSNHPYEEVCINIIKLK